MKIKKNKHLLTVAMLVGFMFLTLRCVATPLSRSGEAIPEAPVGWIGVTLTDPDQITTSALSLVGRPGSLLVYLLS